MISTGSATAMIICGLLCIIVPIAAMIIYKKKNKDIKISLFFIGGAVFIVFALVLEQILHVFMLPVVMNNTVAYVFYGAFAAGIFEETGRFIAFKTVMRKCTDPKDSVMYGLGHGGTEAILLTGITLLANAVVFIMINQLGTDAVISFLSVGNAETEDILRSQLNVPKPGYFISVSALAFMERIIAMTFHTAISVIVFESARTNGRAWLFPVCVFLHTVLDIPVAMYQRQVISEFALYSFISVITGIVVVLAVSSYRRINRAMASSPEI